MNVTTMQLSKLNKNRLLLFVLALFLAVAVGMYSPADGSAAVDGGRGHTGPDAVCYYSTYPEAQRASCVARIAKQEKAKADKRLKNAKAKRAAEDSDHQADVTPAVPASNNPSVVNVAIQASTPDISPDPVGNIYIVSYVDKPDINTPNDHDRRIGGVSVTIKRAGGNESCSTHTTNKGKTFQLEKRKGRDGKLHIVKGSIMFANCNAGSYTVTAVGRKGYSVIPTNPRTITVNKGETSRVSFVLQKKIKAKSTGGAAAPTSAQ